MQYIDKKKYIKDNDDNEIMESIGLEIWNIHIYTHMNVSFLIKYCTFDKL